MLRVVDDKAGIGDVLAAGDGAEIHGRQRRGDDHGCEKKFVDALPKRLFVGGHWNTLGCVAGF